MTTTKKTAVLFAFILGAYTTHSASAVDEPYDIKLIEITGEVHLDEITSDGNRHAIIHKEFHWDPSQVQVSPEPPLEPNRFQGGAGAGTSESRVFGGWLEVGAYGSFSESWYPSYNRYTSINLTLHNGARIDTGLKAASGTYSEVEGSAWSSMRFQIDLKEEMVVNFSLLTGSIDGHVSSVSRESLQDQRWSQLIFEDETRGETIELIAEGENSSERSTHYRRLKPGKYMITMNNWVQMHAEDSTEVIHINVTPDGDFFTVRIHERGTVEMRFRKSPLTDLNSDGKVNGKDLALLMGVWGTDGRGTDENGPYMADLDVDGKVGGKDLALLMGDWDG